MPQALKQTEVHFRITVSCNSVSTVSINSTFYITELAVVINFYTSFSDISACQ